MTSAPRTLTAATRASRLARWQTDRITAALTARCGISPPTTVVITSEGDRDTTTPLPALGGRGIFTEALERELLTGSVDFAVHSLKDLPIDATPGLVIAAVCFREDAADVLVSDVGHQLSTLPRHARVGTCSVRRAAQLLAVRSDLTILPLRGNIDRRLRAARSGEFDAIVLAAAGLLRLGFASRITERLPFEVIVPAPGQGALAVQCRADDPSTQAMLALLDDPPTRAATDAERGFLDGLGGGCLAPIAAHATIDGPTLTLTGLVADPRGTRVVRVHAIGASTLGRELGLRLADEARRRDAGELLA